MTRIFVLIPLYNNRSTVRDVVTRTLRFRGEVLVVDDGSSDGGGEALEDLPVTLVRHDRNLGKGAAILTGARHAEGMGATHVITMDADGQHSPEDLERFILAVEQNPWAVIVGKRDFDSADVPAGRRFGRAFSNFWLRVQTGRSVGDVQSGYRAYPLYVLNGLKLREKRFTFEIEVLVKAAWAGVELKDLEVSVYYAPPDKRVSHYRLFRDNLRLTVLNSRLTMRCFLPWPHRKITPEGGSPENISIMHPLRSLRILLAGDASPERLGASGALGIFLGALPLIACHTVVILFAAGYMRLNKIAAVTASQLCMPPLVPALCIEAGYFLRHGTFLTEISLETLGYQAIERIYEWFLGALILGPVMGVAAGGLIYGVARFLRWNVRSA